MSEESIPRLMQGSEACAEGAVAAGMRFFAGYPITPASEIAEILSRRLPQVGGNFIQMEDEIASMAAIIGASLGGLKSMTATSGPGFSLMQENLGFAASAEIPCVVVEVQRAGPSTGQPTSPSQGDVMQARWGTHGDHPIIVLSPYSVREMFDLTIRAFNLSEKYRTPVILLADEVIAHLREKVVLPRRDEIDSLERPAPTVPPEWYFPYDNSMEVPPLATFGEGYRFHVTGLYHDRSGFPTLRPDEIAPWFERVFAKIDHHLGDIVQVDEQELDDAEIGLVAYGCTARAAKAAMRLGREKGLKVGMLRLKTLWPFPEKEVTRLSRRVDRIVVPEMNRGQIRHEVERLVKGRAEVVGVNRLDGEMITPTQIFEAIEPPLVEEL
ncbi:MAG: 2-oxoacid:acceptor oxidoreductase subunit alpha [Actinobacteria bacterium]|nr:2-oxoacid:acceptor oxidoreductase subunit alpha [Actinomycetota bacterium]